MVCFIFRDDFSNLGYAEFKNSAVFVNDSDDISFLVFGKRESDRPHMLFYHIPFENADIGQLAGIFNSDA